MRIVLVSHYAVTNIGDKILTECLCKILSEKGHSVRMVDINGRIKINENDDEEIRIIKRQHSDHIRSNRNEFISHFQENLSDCDLLIFAGGAILDVLSEYTAEDINTIISIAREKNIPVAFNSVGFFGNEVDNEKGMIIRKALLSPNVKWISVRERKDDIAYLLNGEKEFSYCCDTAVWARELFGVDSSLVNQDNIIGINLINKFAFSYFGNSVFDVSETYFKIYSELTDLGFKCNFFINGPAVDHNYANSFARKYIIPSEMFLLDDNTRSGKAFLSFLSQFSLVISSRLHTSISCFSLKIPSLCLSWDRKMDEFYRNISRPYWLIAPNDVNNISIKVKNALAEQYNGVSFQSYKETTLFYINKMLDEMK